MGGKGIAFSSLTNAFEFPAASGTENSDWFKDTSDISSFTSALTRWLLRVPAERKKKSLKVGFHWRRSCSRSRSRKSASDLLKIENRSRKRSHKLDGLGIGRIKTVPFLPISAYDSDNLVFIR